MQKGILHFIFLMRLKLGLHLAHEKNMKTQSRYAYLRKEESLWERVDFD